MAIDDLRRRDWLLLPGTLCTQDVFTGILDALEIPAEHRIPIQLDRPNIADYETDLFRRAQDSVICGFSLGAIVAAHFADQFDAKRLILFGLNPFPDDPAKETSRRDLARDVKDLGGARAMAPRLPPLSGPKPGASREAILSMADASASSIDAQTNLALTRPGAIERLSRARAPVFVLTGSEDQMAPPEQGKAAADAAPVGRFALLPDLGHYALIEDPATCAAYVLELEETHL